MVYKDQQWFPFGILVEAKPAYQNTQLFAFQLWQIKGSPNEGSYNSFALVSETVKIPTQQSPHRFTQYYSYICFSIRFLCESLADFGSENSAKKCELTHRGENNEFPKDFLFGVSTAAYQIEGAWNEDGRAPSIWDTYTHEQPEMISDNSTGDNAAESYHRFDQDLVALKELKVQLTKYASIVQLL